MQQRVTNWTGMRCAGYVAVWITREHEWRFMVGKVTERSREMLTIRWKKILKCILGKYFEMV